MSFIRQLDTSLKLYACLAILMGLSTALSLLLLSHGGQMNSITAGTAQKLSAAPAWAWIGIVALPALAAMLAVWLRAEMARPLHQATAIARKVAAGDLGTRIDAGAGGAAGVLLDTMGEMNDKLVGMIVKVRTGTESIAAGAGDFASGSKYLSARTEEQAASLGQTGASMAQLAASIRHNAGHACQASQLALSASVAARKGGADAAEAAGTMAAMGDASRHIADIAGVIGALASQTGMLAQGAAAEAAHAGAQGRGFAAVAAQVRTLAQRSAEAAGAIKLLIDDAAPRLDAGARLAGKAGDTLHGVAASALRVAAVTGEMADRGAVQAGAIDAVNLSIAAMAQASRDNAGLAEQAAAAAAALRDQAGGLSRASAAFTLGPGHPGTAPVIHLVSSNPNRLAKPRSDARPKGATMRVVAARPATPAAGMRGRGNAAHRDLDWEEF